MGVGGTVLRGSASGTPTPAKEIATADEELGLPAGALIGDYVITSELGRGGMGIVYAARHPAIGKEVAIKVVHRSLSDEPGVKQRVLQEARILTEVRNAHVVDIYSFGELADGRYYLVMELVEGTSLAGQLRCSLVPTLEAVEILIQIADALTACHASGVVHRDLKPDNIFLRKQGPAVDATLLDFGIAKVEGLEVDRGLTARGMILGTPDYMSPEQARAEEIDARSDLYSLGILAFEILTGRLPFAGATVIETLHAILNETPPSACQLRPDLPAELGELVAELMEKNPDARPSIQEVSVRLKTIRAMLVDEFTAKARVPRQTAPGLATAGWHTPGAAESGSHDDASLVPPPTVFARLKRYVAPALAGAALLLTWMLPTGSDVQAEDDTTFLALPAPAPARDMAELAPPSDPRSAASALPDSALEPGAPAPAKPPKKASVRSASRSHRGDGAKEHRRRSRRASDERVAIPGRERLAPNDLLDPFGKKTR